jgi:uroporphyrinogen decarboxylase
MTGRERIQAALSHREGDRCPLYLWVFDQPGVIEQINARFGSMDAFADDLDLDMIQAFPNGGPCLPSAFPADLVTDDPTFGRVVDIAAAVDVPFGEVDADWIYEPIRAAVEHHQGRRGRAVFVQTPGVFECANGFLGLQQQLMALALTPELAARLYERIADWSCAYIDHCADLGVDTIHVSDDWGMQHGLLFRPEVWQRYIRPATERIAAAARRRGLWLSLHSDGDVTALLPSIVEVGFNVCHPVQESAGMNALAVKQRFKGQLALYGGLDVQTVLGRGRPDLVADEVRRLLRTLKPGGGYIFCTSHMVQPGTPLDEVIEAYAVAREEAVY